jgi:hypothetical protein
MSGIERSFIWQIPAFGAPPKKHHGLHAFSIKCLSGWSFRRLPVCCTEHFRKKIEADPGLVFLGRSYLN